MRKHFLILMLLSILPLAGFAVTLDVSKFHANNVDYGVKALPGVTVPGGEYTTPTDYTVVTDKFYTSDTGAGETAVGAGGANLKVAAKGKYFIKVLGAGDYEGQTIYVDFWINGIDVTIDFNAHSKTFGEKDPAITYILSGGITEKQLGLTVSRKEGENKGKYAYSFEWTNKNYDLIRDGGDEDVFTINAKPIGGSAVITAWQGDVVYTGNDIYGKYTVKDGETTLTFDKDYTVSVAHNVGKYSPTITFIGNYSGHIDVAGEKAFNVTQAPIIVGVEDLEALYDGTTDFHDQTTAAAGKFTYSGLVGADIANAATIKSGFTAPTSVVTTAAKAINAGEYELTITGGNTPVGSNYKFTVWMPGKLTIKQAPLAIKAADASKSIGEKDPKFELDYTGPLTITGVTFTREEGETAGEYKITPNVDGIVIMNGKVDVTANYKPTIDKNKGKLTIGKTPIYVTIKDSKKLYGQADPKFEYTVIGLKGEDKLGDFTITRTAGEKPNGYALTATVENPNADKYSEVIVANGIFTISKAQLEFTIPAQNIKVGDDATKLSKDLIKVKGINNSDKAADLYDLSIKAGTNTAIDNSAADGIQVDLKTTNVKVDGKNVAITELYEIVLDKTVNPWTVGTTTYGKLIVGKGNTTAIGDLDYATIENRAGETASSVTVKITAARIAREVPAGTAHPWKAMTWNTMVLPFEVSAREISNQLGYAIVNVVDPSKTTADNVQFKLEMDKIPANTPFCVKTDVDIAAKDLTFANKLIVDGGEYPSVDAGMGYKFVGAYKNLKIDKTTPTYNFLRGDNNKWAHIGATSANEWTVVPFDAYVDLTAASAPEAVTFTFQELDGTLTAIKNVDASVNDVKAVKAGWYTIDGKKLNAAPAQKGLYIYNGKKYVVK